MYSTRIDNIVAVSYINLKGGGRKQDLNNLCRQFWFWCIERQTHLQGRENVHADRLSRKLNDDLE